MLVDLQKQKRRSLMRVRQSIVAMESVLKCSPGNPNYLIVGVLRRLRDKEAQLVEGIEGGVVSHGE